jgi:hypothetical protein
VQLPRLAEVRDEIFDRVVAVRVGEEDYLLADAAGAPELIESLYHDRDNKLAWEGRKQIDDALNEKPRWDVN